MAITVKYFAVLRERSGRAEDILDYETGMTVADAWRRAMPGDAVPDNLKAAVNMEYARLDAGLEDGDEVAFFPSVTGG